MLLENLFDLSFFLIFPPFDYVTNVMFADAVQVLLIFFALGVESNFMYGNVVMM